MFQKKIKRACDKITDFGTGSHVLLLFVFLFLFAPLYAQAPASANRMSLPRLESDPRALEFFELGVVQGGFTWENLAEISLWASGVDETASLFERINVMADAIKNSSDFPVGKREQAEFILEYMHKNLLRSYVLTQTRMDTMFTTGRYNCVSSGVLYMILGKSVGLDISGVMTRDHAFVTVHIDGENIDVETTNLHGFDPGNRRDSFDQFGRVTGYAYVPARNYRDRQTISPIELVSLILHNRIVEHETRNRFADVIPLAVDRAALLTGFVYNADGAIDTDTVVTDAIFEDPQQYFMNRLFNFGAFLLNSGREEDCIYWATHLTLVYPDETRWHEFIMKAVNNRIARYVRAGHLPDAKTFLAAQQTLLSSDEYTQLDSMLLDTELLEAANKISTAAEGDRVLTAIEEARLSGRINERRASELLIFAIRRTASILSAAPARDWLAAIQYLQAAMARFGSNAELAESLAAYQVNRARDFHNRFATAYNRRDFDEAERVLNEGLAEFPDNRQLLANRETLNRSRR